MDTCSLTTESTLHNPWHGFEVQKVTLWLVSKAQCLGGKSGDSLSQFGRRAFTSQIWQNNHFSGSLPTYNHHSLVNPKQVQLCIVRCVRNFRIAPNWPTFPPKFPKYGLHRHTIHIGNSYKLTITHLSEEQMVHILGWYWTFKCWRY